MLCSLPTTTYGFCERVVIPAEAGTHLGPTNFVLSARL